MSPAVADWYISQGALGVCLLLFIGLYLAERVSGAKTAKEHAAALAEKDKAHQAALTAAYSRLESEKTALIEAHASDTRALLDQMGDLREAHAIRERACLQTVEDFAKTIVNGVDELGRIANAVRRNHDRQQR